MSAALAAQVQWHCKLTASAPTETSGAAVSWTSRVSTAVGALKLSCVSHTPAHKQDLLASVQFHKSLLFLTDPGKSAMCCAVVQESVLCFPLWRAGNLPVSEGRISLLVQLAAGKIHTFKKNLSPPGRSVHRNLLHAIW